MQRILEPELMEDEPQAIAYAKANFSSTKQWYVDHLKADFPDSLQNVLDIGCGPAEVMIKLASYVPTIHITAIDGSAAMIKLAQQAVQSAGLAQQITLEQRYIPGLPFAEHSFSAILSKDLLHHLPDPSVLWQEAQRLGKSGAAIYVMDLYRPESPEAAMHMVESAAANEDPILKRDFYNSLCAAFMIEEVRGQLQTAHLNLQVAQISERHMLIKGTL